MSDPENIESADTGAEIAPRFKICLAAIAGRVADAEGRAAAAEATAELLRGIHKAAKLAATGHAEGLAALAGDPEGQAELNAMAEPVILNLLATAEQADVKSAWIMQATDPATLPGDEPDGRPFTLPA